jgi:hypothetical protein
MALALKCFSDADSTGLRKFLHNKLPLHTFLHVQNPMNDPTCPTCRKERQRKKNPEARHHDLREYVTIAPKSPTRQAPKETSTLATKAANKQTN